MKTDMAEALYRAALGTAVISLVVAATLAAVLIGVQYRGKVEAFVDSERVSELKESLAGQPTNEELKIEIRNVDQHLRGHLFRGLSLSGNASRLLVWSTVIFLLSAHAARSFRKRAPNPLAWGPRRGEAEQRSLRRTRVALGSTLCLAVVSGLVFAKRAVQLPAADIVRARLAVRTPAGSTFPTDAEIMANWPWFRGPEGNGRALHANVPLRWDESRGVGIAWKAPVALPGFGSPIAWGDRVYVTGANETEQAVFCFDAGTGKLLWTSTVDVPGGVRAVKVTEDTGFAAATPATDGRGVYAIFADGTVAGFDVEGRQRWALNLGVPKNPYGHSQSLLVHQDRVLVLFDQAYADDGKSKLLALDTRTGRVLWDRKRPVNASWTSPLLATGPGGRRALIACAEPWLAAYDALSGEPLWQAKCVEGEAAPSPIMASEQIFAVSPGYRLNAVRWPRAGDATPTQVDWTAEDGVPDICSPATDGERVYLLTTNGKLTCYGAAVGDKLWERSLRGEFYASPAVADGKLYVTAHDGRTLLLAAGDEFRGIATNRVGEACYASPAFLDGAIFQRSARHLYRIAGVRGDR